jgi:hypothetical protein
MRRSPRFSGSESLIHTRSLVVFITTMSGFRFSVHTRSFARYNGFRASSTAPRLLSFSKCNTDATHPVLMSSKSYKPRSLHVKLYLGRGDRSRAIMPDAITCSACLNSV